MIRAEEIRPLHQVCVDQELPDGVALDANGSEEGFEVTLRRGERPAGLLEMIGKKDDDLVDLQRFDAPKTPRNQLSREEMMRDDQAR